METCLPADWVIVRIGHTSTGHKNETVVQAKDWSVINLILPLSNCNSIIGLAKAFEKTDACIGKRSTESFSCRQLGMWQPELDHSYFQNEFKKRRGYDLIPYLLVMTGVPIEDAATSEKFLHDVRQTIAELVNDIFYTTLEQTGT